MGERDYQIVMWQPLASDSEWTKMFKATKARTTPSDSILSEPTHSPIIGEFIEQ